MCKKIFSIYYNVRCDILVLTSLLKISIIRVGLRLH